MCLEVKFVSNCCMYTGDNQQADPCYTVGYKVGKLLNRLQITDPCLYFYQSP